MERRERRSTGGGAAGREGTATTGTRLKGGAGAGAVAGAGAEAGAREEPGEGAEAEEGKGELFSYKW